MSIYPVVEQAQIRLKSIQECDESTLKIFLQDHADPVLKVVNLYKMIPLEHIGLFPNDNVESLFNLSSDADKHLKKINDSGKDFGKVEREGMANVFQNMYSRTFDALMPFISFCMLKEYQDQQNKSSVAIKNFEEEYHKLENKVGGLDKRIEDGFGNFNAQKDDKIQEIDKILGDIKGIAALQGITPQAIFFKKEANKNACFSGVWLFAAIVFAAILLAIPIDMLVKTEHHWLTQIPKGSLNEILPQIFGRLLAVGVLTYGLYFTAKNFFAARHLVVINKHRQNALQTYESLVAAAKDTANTDIILTQAAACIFSPQPTGYFSQKDGGVQYPNPFGHLIMKAIEVAK